MYHLVRRRLLANTSIAVIASLVLAACNVGSGASNTKASIRFVNLMTDQSSLSVKVNGTARASDLGYATASAYSEIDSGTFETIASGNTGVTLRSEDVGYTQASSTVYYYGNASSVGSLKVIEDTAMLTSGKFRVRTLRLAPNLAALDLYVTEAGTDLNSVTATSAAAAVASASSYGAETSAGAYRVRLALAGTKEVVFDTTLSFSSGTYNTLVLYSLGSAQLPTVLWMQTADGTAKQLPNTLARVRVVQATPDVATTRVALGDTAVFQSLPFGGVTNYLLTAAGSRNIEFRDQDRSVAYISSPLSLQAGHDYTAYALGKSAAARVAVFDENGSDRTSTTTVRAQFINASADQSAIDVVLDYVPVASAVGFGNRSAWNVINAGAYSLGFYPSSGGSLLAQRVTTSDDTALDTGASYGFALLGDAGNHRIVSYRVN